MYNYLEICSYRTENFGEDEFNRVTFYSCVAFLMNLDCRKLNISIDEYKQRMSHVEESAENIVMTCVEESKSSTTAPTASIHISEL